MLENDPFEDFKRQRQIEFLEKKFTGKEAVNHEKFGEIVRESKNKTELAARIESEMRDFFNESQDQVSRVIQDSDVADTAELEEKVQEEMADFFRLSSEKASDILDSIDEDEDAGAVADEMVDHLRSVFQQGIAHIADVKQLCDDNDDDADASAADPADESGRDGPELRNVARPANAALPPLTHNHSLMPRKDSAPSTSTAPTAAPTPLPPKITQGMGPEPGDDLASGDDLADVEDTGGARILKRQNHLPGAGRRGGISLTEVAELRALKAILLEKGIITREELDARMGRTP